MRQRVMIALALVGCPDILIADEATTALDVTTQQGILSLLAELRRELGMAVLFVTHDLRVMEQVCETVVVMYAGRTVEHGRVQEVLSEPIHPYTQSLLRSRPECVRPGERIPTIPGVPTALGEESQGCSFAPRCSRAACCCGQDPPILQQAHSDHWAACSQSAAEVLE
jgi:peptide/nickel transport system ATP-binding protein